MAKLNLSHSELATLHLTCLREYTYFESNPDLSDADTSYLIHLVDIETILHKLVKTKGIPKMTELNYKLRDAVITELLARSRKIRKSKGNL